MTKLTDRQKILYYRKRNMVKKYILAWARRNRAVVYGATGLNIHMPRHLRSHTRDIDMYTRNPKVSAHQLEEHLDEVFGGDYFEVERAQYPNTYKVKSRVTLKTRADLTKPKTKIHSKYVRGQKVASIRQIIKNRKASLRNPEAKFRHQKDKLALEKIRLSKKQKNSNAPKGFVFKPLKSLTTKLPMSSPIDKKGKKRGNISLW